MVASHSINFSVVIIYQLSARSVAVLMGRRRGGEGGGENISYSLLNSPEGKEDKNYLISF